MGRTRELGRLRTALDQREATVVRVTGLRGGGKTALVRRALADYPHVAHAAPPLPDPTQRASLHAAVSRARGERGLASHTGASRPEWEELLRGLLELAEPDARPFVLVLDDAHRLAESRSRHLGALRSVLATARAEGRALHVVLVGPERALPAAADLPDDTPEPVRVGPLPFRAAARLLPGTRPADLLRAYGVFGGIPRVLAAVDRATALGTNIRRLMIADDAPLVDAGATWLERDVQTPARYYAILSALAEGEADWKTLHAGLEELTRSGQVAPYLKRLEELGLLAQRRSLDAPPRARSRRYAIADPFLASWLRFVLAGSSAPAHGDAYTALVRPALDAHAARVFPLVCRQHMAHDAVETVGTAAREGGSLWGAGYDIPVAGILASGAAYYGSCHWGPIAAGEAPLDALDRQIRETRYGFGRQQRIRILFTHHEAPRSVQREVARRYDAELIDAADLAGTG